MIRNRNTSINIAKECIVFMHLYVCQLLTYFKMWKTPQIISMLFASNTDSKT